MFSVWLLLYINFHVKNYVPLFITTLLLSLNAVYSNSISFVHSFIFFVIISNTNGSSSISNLSLLTATNSSPPLPAIKFPLQKLTLCNSSSVQLFLQGASLNGSLTNGSSFKGPKMSEIKTWWHSVKTFLYLLQGEGWLDQSCRSFCWDTEVSVIQERWCEMLTRNGFIYSKSEILVCSRSPRTLYTTSRSEPEDDGLISLIFTASFGTLTATATLCCRAALNAGVE